MKIILLLVIYLGAALKPLTEPKVQELRNLFYLAATNKQSSVKLSTLLLPVDAKSAPVLVCYKGVAELMEAKYIVNPLTKLSKFKSGKELIEQAIKRDPDDTEMRFLRFSVQTNLPSFLGYDKEITSDKNFLLDKANEINDSNFRNNVIRYLSSSKYCTDEERKDLEK